MRGSMKEVSPMEDKKIYLLAELTILPGFLKEAKANLKGALIPTLQEPGYEALYETGRNDDPHKLVFFEVFSSASAHEFHLEQDLYKAGVRIAGGQDVRSANTDQIERTLTTGTPQQTRRGLLRKRRT
jgi:quinol monooxygenase YgiN